MRIHRSAFKASWIMLLPSLVAGCTNTRPTAPASQPVLPAYVYPAEPPIVETADLPGVLVRLDARRTLLWVFEQADDTSTRLACLLAAERDSLRTAEVEVFGLYTGPPDGWQTLTRPMLRSAQANFPCAVLAPDQADELAAWLSAGRGGSRPEGAFVLGRTGGLLAAAAPNAASVRACIEELTGRTRSPGSPGPDPSPEPPSPRDRARSAPQIGESRLATP